MGTDEDIQTGEYVGKYNDGDNDEEEGKEVVVYAIVLWGANGDRLPKGDDPLHPACRARSSSSTISASVMSKVDLACD